MFIEKGFCKKFRKMYSLVIAVLICGLSCAVYAADNADKTEKVFLPRYYSQLDNYFTVKNTDEPEITVEIISYTIQPGDTLYHISRKYGTDISTLSTLNSISNPNLIYPGDKLEILTATGLVHTVRAGETMEQIASSYYTDKEEIIRLSGAPENVLREGERLVIPAAAGVTAVSRGASGLTTKVPSFDWPLEGTITSPFGWRRGGFHYGLDIAAPMGTPVFAAADGTVVFNDYRGTYGLLVEIEHGPEWKTRYAHNSEVLVQSGQKVFRGEIIARVGSTGNSTGPHVHFEIIYRDERLNPVKYLP